MMRAVQLIRARQLKVTDLPEPPPPGSGEVLVEILSVGVCGSDLHMYQTGSIGDIRIEKPLILGHEFSARILATGEKALDEGGNPVPTGQRVAVEPHVACGHCEQCLEGNPNLCPHHTFYGVAPTDGALRDRMIVRSRNCFPIPDELSNDSGALLETLGVALHAVDLARIRIGNSVAVIGCGPVGALIARLAVLAGARPVLAFDLLEWRARLARSWGAEAWSVKDQEAVDMVKEQTAGRGVDVAIEAAWADHSVQQAVDMVRPGGRLVMTGIPPDDEFRMRHSVARRKGLTIRMSRRMKHTYPRALALTAGSIPSIQLDELATHTFPLEAAEEAFSSAANYRENLAKALIRVRN